jgi:hypothetical protein
MSIECFGEGWWKSYFSERRLVKILLFKNNPRKLPFDN